MGGDKFMRGQTIKDNIEKLEYRRSTKHFKYREDNKSNWKCVNQLKKWETFFQKGGLK